MFHREIKIPERQSFFLFGARGTGKTTLLRAHFPEAETLYINLLLAAQEDLYSRTPDRLIGQVNALPPGITTIIIDEIQKVPKLLDVVHELLETTKMRFVLTGSSARKLRHGSANLLAGRAVHRALFPLTYRELGDRFDLDAVLKWGSLPGIFSASTETEKFDFLSAYSQIYLKEEIWAEHLIRKLDPFRKFLEVAAQMNGKQINFSQIARQCGADVKSVQSYYQILEDTLVGFFVESYAPSVRKSIKQAPKFYMFDTGVTRAISRMLDVEPSRKTSYYGELFEALVVTEIHRAISYGRKQYQMFFLRTQAGNEIDLIIDRPGKPKALIEIKSSNQIDEQKLKNMLRFADEFSDAEYYVLCQETSPEMFDRIKIMPWQKGIEEILR